MVPPNFSRWAWTAFRTASPSADTLVASRANSVSYSLTGMSVLASDPAARRGGYHGSRGHAPGPLPAGGGEQPFRELLLRRRLIRSAPLRLAVGRESLLLFFLRLLGLGGAV